MEEEIIEVESVDKSIHEASPNAKPKKAKYQYGRRIEKFTKLDWLCLRFFFPGFILGAIATLLFAIGYWGHPDNVFFLIFFILALAVLALAILAFAFHFVLRAMIKRWMKKDPNYEG